MMTKTRPSSVQSIGMGIIFWRGLVGELQKLSFSNFLIGLH